jgi:tetratricopeptide (TPR) repeat protein
MGGRALTVWMPARWRRGGVRAPTPSLHARSCRRGVDKGLVTMALLALIASSPDAWATDIIEQTLAHDIGQVINTSPQPDDLPQSDLAYLYFLQAAYGTDPSAAARAAGLYRRLDLPASQAFLGSLDILEARSLSQRGALGALVHFFAERRLVLQGIDKLDAAVSAHPDDVDVRVVRAITYLQLPSFFGKFDAGLQDIQLILQWIQNQTAVVPNDDPLFRDQASLYYYAGRYFQKTGQHDKAREMFLQSSQASPHSPFARAAARRVQQSRSRI